MKLIPISASERLISNSTLSTNTARQKAIRDRAIARLVETFPTLKTLDVENQVLHVYYKEKRSFFQRLVKRVIIFLAKLL